MQELGCYSGQIKDRGSDMPLCWMQTVGLQEENWGEQLEGTAAHGSTEATKLGEAVESE
jgi:hypothetical protein